MTTKELELAAIIRECVKQLRSQKDFAHANMLEDRAAAWADEVNTADRLAEMDAFTR